MILITWEILFYFFIQSYFIFVYCLELVTQKKFYKFYFFELVTGKFHFKLLFRISNSKILICLFNWC